jgi:hypothetical protein
MRAGPLSNTNIIALLNQHFVPVYVVNEDYAKRGPAPAEEKAELQRIFKEGYAAKKSVGSVHVYILNPEGRLIDSMHVAEAAKSRNLEALLRKTVADLRLRPGDPVAKVRSQSAAPTCDSDSLVLHLVSRSLDGRGAWTEFPVENWIVLSPAEQKALLPPGSLERGASWTPDPEVLKKLLTHFYPATENNDVKKNRFDQLSVSASVIELNDGTARARLSGTFKMAHDFYHKEDGKAVEAEFVGFAKINTSDRRLLNLQITTRNASYNGGKFAVALRTP